MLNTSKKITPDLLVTEIVTSDYRTAEVFKKYNIDFCCGGKMSLTAACDIRGLNENDVLEDLKLFAITYQNLSQWPVDFIVEYLLNVHHNYFKNCMPVLQEYIDRFVLSHFKKYPGLQELPMLSQQLYSGLNKLINYEKEILFPYIKNIVCSTGNNEFYGISGKLSPEEFSLYHGQIKACASQIIQLTNNFLIPANACVTHKVMLQKLEEFINHIWQHFYIEDKFLIARCFEN